MIFVNDWFLDALTAALVVLTAALVIIAIINLRIAQRQARWFDTVERPSRDA